MGRYVVPVVTRYASVALQFVVVAVITRALPLHEGGTYFVLMGLVLSTYFLAGFGLPDGMVRVAPALAATHNTSAANALTRLGFRRSICTIPVGTAACFFAAHIYSGGWLTAALTGAWWMAYGLIFVAAQLVVARGRGELGAALFYSAANVGQILITIPLVVFMDMGDLDSVLAAVVLGTSVSATACLAWAYSSGRSTQNSESTGAPQMKEAWKQGAMIAAGRVVQACLLWSPVWIASLVLGGSEAAIVGLACRLVSAVAAVLAAVRFSIRPSLSQQAAKGEWSAIELHASRIALYATGLSLIAILAVSTVGGSLVAATFGSDYRAAGLTTALMLVGTLGECIGGPVDEILRMAGHAGEVIVIQLIALILGAGLQLWASVQFGTNQLALAYSATFVCLYAAYIFRLRRLHGILVLPRLFRKPVRSSA